MSRSAKEKDDNKEIFNLFLGTILNPPRVTKHYCKVQPHLDALRERYPSNSFKHRWFRALHSIFLPNVFILKKKSAYISKYDTYSEKKRLLFYHQFIIHPHSLFYEVWTVIMLFVSICILFVYPLVLCRINLQEHIHHQFYSENLMELIEVVAVLDIFIKFITGFYNDQNKLEIDLLKIYKNYVHTTFILDVLVAFPVNCLNVIIGQDIWFNLHNKYVNILSVLKILRYIPFIKVLDDYLKFCIRNRWLIILIEAQISVIVYAHWHASMLLIATSWDSMIVFRNSSFKTDQHNWLTVNDKWKNVTLIHLYGFALMRTLGNMFNIENPDKNSISEDLHLGINETFVTSYITISSQFLFIFYLCRMYQVYEFRNRKRFRRDTINEQVKLYLNQMDYDYYTKIRIMMTVNERIESQYHIDQQFSRQMKFINSCALLSDIPLFNIFPQEIKMRLASCLIQDMYFPGDQIDVGGDEMALHFIKHGSIAIYLHKNVEIKHLCDGDFLGLFKLFYNRNYPLTIKHVTYVALELCTVYNLPKITFDNLVKSYPQFLVILERYTEYVVHTDMHYAEIEKAMREEREIFNDEDQ